jgi:hypothetical protein
VNTQATGLISRRHAVLMRRGGRRRAAASGQELEKSVSAISEPSRAAYLETLSEVQIWEAIAASRDIDPACHCDLTGLSPSAWPVDRPWYESIAANLFWGRQPEVLPQFPPDWPERGLIPYQS